MASSPKTNYNACNIELLMRYRESPSVELRNRIVSLNAGLVHSVTGRLHLRCSEPYEDLQQIGYLGLIRAIERFDTHRGGAFSTFAVPYIRGEILHFLRDSGSLVRIPRRFQELCTKADKKRVELFLELGYEPSSQEIAQSLGLSEQEFNEVEMARTNHHHVSLDVLLYNNAERSESFITRVSYSEQDAEASPHQEQRQAVKQAIGGLEVTTRCVLESIFFQGMTYRQVAKQVGVSPATVDRRVRKGIQQLSTIFQSQT